MSQLTVKKLEKSTMQWNGTILNLWGEVTDRHCLCFSVFVISAESQLSSFSLVSPRSSEISFFICPPFRGYSILSLAPSSAWQAVRCPEESLTVNCSPQWQPFSCSRCASKAVNTIYTLSSSERSLCFIATKRAITFNGWCLGCLLRKTVCDTSHF